MIDESRVQRHFKGVSLAFLKVRMLPSNRRLIGRGPCAQGAAPQGNSHSLISEDTRDLICVVPMFGRQRKSWARLWLVVAAPRVRFNPGAVKRKFLR